VIENLWIVTFNLGATEQAVTAPQGQILVIKKMKNMEKRRVQEHNFKAITKLSKANPVKCPCKRTRENVLFGRVIMSICCFPFCFCFLKIC